MFNLNGFRQKSPQQRFLSILGLAMFLVYLALGVILIAWSDMPVTIERKYRIIFGCLLIVYAAIRLTRVLKQEEPE
ncbi:hypothetical protein [Pedobacter deserti]|uniref:hypothetical protein n=1 Tax=Pedobacter deserti TaxID=2817382 RepID=UPI00210C1107|nr:hypothetical protein [Pedobacter sp. SYSU D00382]